MDLRKTFDTDSKLEVEGVWHDIGEGASVKVARDVNPAYAQTLSQLSKPYALQMRQGTMDDKVANEILCRAMAKTILVDWKGMTEDGKTLPYSEEAAFRLLVELNDFRALISTLSTQASSYRKAEKDKTAKNSKKSSGGN